MKIGKGYSRRYFRTSNGTWICVVYEHNPDYGPRKRATFSDPGRGRRKEQARRQADENWMNESLKEVK